MKPFFLVALLALATACAPKKEQPVETPAPKEPEPETMSFSGAPLFAKPADSLALVKSDSAINAIKAKGELSEDDYVEVGRQLVSTNRYKLAIAAYSEALTKYPNSFKILRHRGHRYINLRQLDNAIADLNKAEELIRNQPEVWEYDAQGAKSATYQHQIWYHIGLYHFLKKSYKEAAEAFEKSLAATTQHEGKNKAGASDWLYNSYQRAGEKDKAAKVLKPFTLDFDIEDKDYPYFRRLLLFKGVIKPAELADESKPIEDMPILEMTKLYGLSSWYAYQGNLQKAGELRAKILQSKWNWPAFAYACAEIDLGVM